MSRYDEIASEAGSPVDRSGQVLLDQLVHCAEAFASLTGYACITERSPNSESTYIHVYRNNFWYGTRLSFHLAAYDCSCDYQQMLVPRNPTPADKERLARQILAITQSGGSIVADPKDVKRAIQKLHDFLVDGRIHVDRDGTRWTWSSRRKTWMPMEPGPTNLTVRPKPHRPRSPLSNRVRSAVRHRQNVQAKWSAELSRNEG